MLTDEELHASCRNEFALHSAVFGAVWFRLTGRILIQAVQNEGYASRGSASAPKTGSDADPLYRCFAGPMKCIPLRNSSVKSK